MKRAAMIRTGLALMLPMLTSTVHGADDPVETKPGIKASIEAVLGEWTSQRIEKVRPEGLGFISEQDEVKMNLKPDGTCDWQFHLKQADKSPTMSTKFMVGTGHLAFVEGGLLVKGEIQLWKFAIKEDEMVLETEPAGLKITLKKKKAQANGDAGGGEQ